MKTATAKFDDARISPKDSLVISRELKDMQVERAKDLLRGLLERKRNLKRKYYSLTAQKFLEVLENAEANAKQKDLNLDRTFVKVAKSVKAGKMMFPKSRSK